MTFPEKLGMWNRFRVEEYYAFYKCDEHPGIILRRDCYNCGLFSPDDFNYYQELRKAEECLQGLAKKEGK